jgi:bifunctional DNA-binding transcriptional regulator/antitoxin component of YhaV-PrlF toxin-antitoxin module
MTSIVDERGCVELPVEVTHQLGLKPGDRVVVETAGGQCTVRPEASQGGLRCEGNVLAHDGVSPNAFIIREGCLNEDIFADMRPYMVAAQEVDDSREAIYTRMEGE